MIKLTETDIKELADGNLKFNKYLNGLNRDELIQTLACNIKLDALQDLNDRLYDVLNRLNEYLSTHSTGKLKKIHDDLDDLYGEYIDYVLE